MVETIKAIDPKLSEEEIRTVVDKLIKKKSQDVDAVLMSDTKDDVKTSLIGACNYIAEKKPVVVGNGSLFMRHSEKLSPMTTMIMEWKLDRGKFKKKEFESKTEEERRYYNKLQLNVKANIMNAWYGVQSVLSVKWFNRFNPAAITLTCQHLTSVTLHLFEAIVGNNNSFLSINDFFDWCYCLTHQKKNLIVDKWITVPSDKDLLKRIVLQFRTWHASDMDIITEYIKNLSDHDKVFIYYANNLNEILWYRNISEKIMLMMSHLPSNLEFDKPHETLWFHIDPDKGPDKKLWNKKIANKLFYNAYEIPETIKAEVSYIQEMTLKYCYVRYIPTDAVTRASTFNRKCVVIMDTDSNMLYSGEYRKTIGDIIGDRTFGRSKKMNNIIATNLLANITSLACADLLETVMIASNSDKPYRDHISMKNEFLYLTMLIAEVKKRYAGSITVQEGNFLDPVKLDIKGFDFKKSKVPKSVEIRLTNILRDRILNTDVPDVEGLMRDIREFENDVKTGILAGNREYYGLATFKNASAYAFPERMQVYRGSVLWNQLYPDDKINSMDKVSIAKLKTKLGGSDCDVICIPCNIKDVPPEVLEAIDAEQLTSDMINVFDSVFESLHIARYTVKNGKNTITKTSNIVTL
jgi:hypothetical protein